MVYIPGITEADRLGSGARLISDKDGFSEAPFECCMNVYYYYYIITTTRRVWNVAVEKNVAIKWTDKITNQRVLQQAEVRSLVAKI